MRRASRRQIVRAARSLLGVVCQLALLLACSVLAATNAQRAPAPREPICAASHAQHLEKSLAQAGNARVQLPAARALGRVAVLPAGWVAHLHEPSWRAGAAAEARRPGERLARGHRWRRIPRLGAEEPPWS